MEEKDRGTLYHYIAWSEFDFVKKLTRFFSGGKENIYLGKKLLKRSSSSWNHFLTNRTGKR